MKLFRIASVTETLAHNLGLALRAAGVQVLHRIRRLVCACPLLRGAALAAVALLTAFANPAWADPPTRAGRIAEVVGDAWMMEPDTQAWSRVLRNQTIAQGDQLRVGDRSKVAVRVGSTSLWLDEKSDIEFLQLDDAALVLRLARGGLALRVRTPQTAAQARIQTREGVISTETEGLVRIGQLDRVTRIAALQGSVRFDSDPAAAVQRAWLREGEQAEFGVIPGSPRLERKPIARDYFSNWFLSQDEMQDNLAMDDEMFVSPEMTGAEELGQYGNWEVAEEHGNIWIPTRVASGWEPYRDGRWVWTRHWGWSWVDNAPWGFAPFHYGRWVQYRGRWAWAPGRFESRPAYAPALVTWSGPQTSITIGIGGSRRPPPAYWTPLPPHQAYVPSYDHSSRYVERFRWDRGADRLRRGDGASTQPYRTSPDNRQSNPVFQTPQSNRTQEQERTERQPWRERESSRYNNSGERGGFDGRNTDQQRGDRSRESFQNPVPQNPVFTPVPVQPTARPNRNEVPIFNRENNGTGSNESARPTPSFPTTQQNTSNQQNRPTAGAAAPSPNQRRALTGDEDPDKNQKAKLKERQERERQNLDSQGRDWR